MKPSPASREQTKKDSSGAEPVYDYADDGALDGGDGAGEGEGEGGSGSAHAQLPGDGQEENGKADEVETGGNGVDHQADEDYPPAVEDPFPWAFGRHSRNS